MKPDNRSEHDLYPFSFVATIAQHMLGTYAYTVVYLNSQYIKTLGLSGGERLRAEGKLNDCPFSGAWQPSRGLWYLMLSKQIMKAGRFAIGDQVQCRFRILTADSVDVPEALLQLFDRDHQARHQWDLLTPGSQRGLAHRVATAKSPETVARRVQQVHDHLRGVTPIRGLSAKRSH